VIESLRDPASQAEALGCVLSVGGSQASIRFATQPDTPQDGRVTVGRFLGICATNALLVGVITAMSAETTADGAVVAGVAQLDLLGEIKGRDGAARFQRGITEYPVIGDTVRPITNPELRLVYAHSGPDTIEIGYLQQDASIAASIQVDEMLRKHFAVFGTTGVGKSSGVATILREVLRARPELRIIMIDPHNEYGQSFGDRAQVLNPRNLRLPFWMFNFEETVDVFFRGRPGLEDEVELLSELIPVAKTIFASTKAQEPASLRKGDAKPAVRFTGDTPVPYRLQDLISLLDERMGRLENRSHWARFHRLMARIETVRNDPRYAFMFDNANVGGDTMIDCLSVIFRLPAQGRPMTILQLAGFPAEVVDSVVSVLCRTAFDFGLWSDGAFPMLFVCEEAHRYAPADRTIGFGPTRKAIARIAKEGRKYGVHLGLVTQRPAELDSTIISQCSTLFAMRMANDADQAIVRSAVSDAAASLIAFVPSLGTREVFAFGEGVSLPTRLRFGELPAHAIPRSEAVSRGQIDCVRGTEREFVSTVIERWRGAMTTQGTRADRDDDGDDFESMAAEEFSLVPSSLTLERERFTSPGAAPALMNPGALLRERTANDATPPASPRAAGAGRPGLDLQDLRRRLRERS
jgi:DNA helicase HerA-like ATPase